jgi:hypothetical protein
VLRLEEIRRSLIAAWQLFLNRPDAMGQFDISVDGFWRSFRAFWLVLPSYALVVLAQYCMTPPGSISGGTFVLENAVSFALDWVTFPIILALAAARLGISGTYPAFIVARNWTGVIGSLPFGLIALLNLTGFTDGGFLSILWLASFALFLRYGFIVARQALRVPIVFATALVVADLLVSLAIQSGLNSLFGLVPAVQ